MSIFIGLLKNEFMKIYGRSSSWLMLGAVAVIASLWSVIWRIAGFASPNLWSIVQDMVRFIFFISLFTVIIAGGIVAREHEGGTIKLILIRPVPRRDVLLAKYIAVLLYALQLMAVLFLISTVVNALYFFVQGIRPEPLLLKTRKAWLTGTFLGVIVVYLLRFVEVWFYSTIAFVLSVTSKNTAMSIGLTMMMMLFAPELPSILPSGTWIRFYPFAQLNLAEIMLSPLKYPGNELIWALCVTIAFIITMIVAGWLCFLRRDVID